MAIMVPSVQRGHEASTLTVTQAAQEAQVSSWTITRWFDNGDLKGFVDQRGIRHVTRSSLAAMIETVPLREAAEMLCLSPSAVRKLYDTGVLVGFQTAHRHRRITRASIDAYIERTTPTR